MAGIRPGDVIAGKFRVERLLGEGGMGYVVAARHLQLGQMVALKFMREEICTPDYKSRFLREARNTVRLKSKHVSRVLDVGALDGGAPYMVMEYLEGTDLSELLHKDGPVPVHEACEYILQACEAIAEAHGYGIVHRDLKPANLFLTRGQGGEPVVKVLDFGVSKVLDVGTDDETNPGRSRHERPDSVVTKASDLLGSPSYMAPEQVVSARDADVRSDVWSLGVILFRLISGVAPFQGESLGELIQGIMHAPIPSLRDVKPDLPPGLEQVVACCLQRERNNRLGDVTELARMLAPYAGPVATPSLERIAILGPSLIASLPMLATPSTPSLNPRSNAAAWTSPPMRSSFSPAEPDKKDLTAATAAVWAAVFVLFVTVSALVVAQIAGSSHLPPVAPVSTAVVLPPAPVSTGVGLPPAPVSTSVGLPPAPVSTAVVLPPAPVSTAVVLPPEPVRTAAVVAPADPVPPTINPPSVDSSGSSVVPGSTAPLGSQKPSPPILRRPPRPPGPRGPARSSGDIPATRD